MELSIIGNWIANIALMSIGYLTRLVWGAERLTKKQLIVFYLFCVGVVYIVDKIPINSTIKSSIILCCGLVIPNIIKGIIGGAKSSQDRISKTIEHNVENIADKVDKIADVLTDKKEET